MKIDYIIPTYNSASLLDKCLIAIEKYGNPKSIIIIDKFSTDKTIEIAKNHGCKIIQTNTTLGECRLIGTENAKTEWIAFVDSDVILNENWAGIFTYLHMKTVGAIQADPKCIGDNVSSFRCAKPYSLKKLQRGFTGATLIKRDIIKDADIKDCQAFEDWFLTQHIIKKDYNWLVVPIVVDHHSPEEGLYYKKRMWHSSALRNYYKNKKINFFTFTYLFLRYFVWYLKIGDFKSTFYFLTGLFKPEYFSMARNSKQEKLRQKMDDDFNVLVIAEYLDSPIGGAELSSMKTALAMKADVCTTPRILKMLVYPDFYDLPFWMKGKVIPFVRKTLIETYVKYRLRHCRADYDFVMTQRYSALPAIRFSQKINAKSILFLRSFSKLHMPEPVIMADIVIANSEFIRRKYTPLRNDIKVLYPPIAVERFKSVSERTNEYISMVSPLECKGGGVFANLAKQAPDRKFLAVGRKDKSIRFPSNVKYLRWIDDMRDFYSQSSVVLIPSIWDEPFSRIAPEAQASGVPVISTKMGGLPESNAGQLFVDNPYDFEEWIEKIAEAETNRGKYVKAGLKNASRFDEREYYRKLKDIMKEYENC